MLSSSFLKQSSTLLNWDRLSYRIGSAELFVHGKRKLERFYRRHNDLEINDIERRKTEKAFLAEELHITQKQIVFLKQEHGISCYPIRPSQLSENQIYYKTGDAVFTQTSRILLTIRTADCLPVFLILTPREKTDTRSLVGLVHAGWKGLHHQVVYLSLQQMLRNFLWNKKVFDSLRIDCILGLCAGEGLYEVGHEVAELFPGCVQEKGNRRFLSLRLAAKRQIEAVRNNYLYDNPSRRKKNFTIQMHYHPIFDEFCTMSCQDELYSHRNGDHGRNLNSIWIKN